MKTATTETERTKKGKNDRRKRREKTTKKMRTTEKSHPRHRGCRLRQRQLHSCLPATRDGVAEWYTTCLPSAPRCRLSAPSSPGSLPARSTSGASVLRRSISAPRGFPVRTSAFTFDQRGWFRRCGRQMCFPQFRQFRNGICEDPRRRTKEVPDCKTKNADLVHCHCTYQCLRRHGPTRPSAHLVRAASAPDTDTAPSKTFLVPAFLRCWSSTRSTDAIMLNSSLFRSSFLNDKAPAQHAAACPSSDMRGCKRGSKPSAG